MVPVAVALLLTAMPQVWGAGLRKRFDLPTVGELGNYVQSGTDMQSKLKMLQDAVLRAMDPRVNGVFDKPETKDVMEKVIFPQLEKAIPGGIPKTTHKVDADSDWKVSKDSSLNVKLEVTGMKIITEQAHQDPQRFKDIIEPKIRDHVQKNWEGNNNTKNFYAEEQVKLLGIAIERKGVLVPGFTESENTERKMWAAGLVIAPLATWAALFIANSMATKTEGTPSDAPVVEEKRFFPHLDGMRTVFACLIIWFHYGGILGPYGMIAAQHGFVKPRYGAVSFFLVLSGFCMHYAYCKKVYRDVWDVLKYMGNRLGRVVPSYWVAWAIFFYVMHPRYSPFLNHHEGWVDRFNEAALWSFFMLQCWTEWAIGTPETITALQDFTGMRENTGGAGYGGDFGNLWTISTLLLPWLFYPVLHALVMAVTRASPGIGLRFLTVLMYVLGVAPAAICFYQYGDEMDGRTTYTLKTNPFMVLPQFVLGMCTAQLLKQAEEKPESIAGVPKWVYTILGDIGITALFLFSFTAPFKSYDRGYEAMFIGGGAHCIAAFLYFSCLPGVGKGVWTTICGSPVMVKMGEYAMHVYLLQYPLAVIMDAAVNGLPADSRPPFVGLIPQIQLVVGLWTMSIIFAEVLDKPLQRRMASLLEKTKK